MGSSRNSERTIPEPEPRTRLGGYGMEKVSSACAYHPVVGSNNPAAALTRNRLDAPNAGDEVSAGYPNHASRTLQDCLAIDDLTDDPIGDLSRFTQALKVQGR